MATNFVSEAKHKPHAIFAIFILHKSVLGVDDRSEIFFQYLKGRCHGNQFSGKNGPKLPTPLHLSLCHSDTESQCAHLQRKLCL